MEKRARGCGVWWTVAKIVRVAGETQRTTCGHGVADNVGESGGKVEGSE